MSAVSCLTWIKRGVAKNTPDKVQLDKETLRRIIEETKEDIEAHEEGEEEEIEDGSDKEGEVNGVLVKETKVSPPDAAPSTSGEGSSSSSGKVTKRKLDDPEMDQEDSEIIDKYGLDDYDDEDLSFQQGIGNLVYYPDNDEDPYLSKDDPEDSDEEDFEIRPTDNLLAVGSAQKDSCLLEFYVYDEPGNNLFVHHDIILPSFPLAVEWLDFDPSDDNKPGNFVAVGSMASTIDVWDVDLMNSLEPVMVLGTKKSKKKNKKKGSVLGHTDSVLDLSWNRNARNVLSSASADCTVGLWDLSEAKAVASIRKHEDKVQCVNWHPAESQTLLSGGFDNTVRLFDCRDASYNHKTWNFGGEIEATVWNHFNPFYFYASTNSGHVYYTDVRQAKPVYTISAHNAPTSCLALSPTVPDLLLTSSEDKTVKIWTVKENQPKLLVTKDMGLGGVMCVHPCPDSSFVFALGGEKNMKVWDIRQSSEVRQYFNTGESSGICLDGTKSEGEDDEDEEDKLVKRTRSLKIRKPRVKSNLDKKHKKTKKKKNPRPE